MADYRYGMVRSPRSSLQIVKSHLPRCQCTGPVVKVEMLGEGGTSENENGAYHLIPFP